MMSIGPRKTHVTMLDVADEAGVSVKTVSNVVNGYPYLRTETRARVEEAITRLGYQVNVTARNLRQGRTGMIALAVPELRLPYFAELAHSVIVSAESCGLRVLIEQTGGRRDREIDVLAGSLRHVVDGVIFSPVALGSADRDRFDVDFPLVLLGEAVFDTAVDHVTMGNVDAARAATTHLLEIGRTRVAALGAHADHALGAQAHDAGSPPGENVSASALRLRGYRSALESAGRPYDPALVASTTAWNRSTGERAMLDLLDSGADFDAVFAFNDALAHGALHALHLRGIGVPAQVAVVGFDDTEESAYSTPTLTSISPGRELIAQRAVELMAGLVKPGARDGDAAPAFVVAPFTLVVRGSTVLEAT